MKKCLIILALIVVSVPAYSQQPILNKLKPIVLDVENRRIGFEYEFIITGSSNVTQARLYFPISTQISDINQFTATPSNETPFPTGGVASDNRTITGNDGLGYNVPASGTYTIRLILSYSTSSATYDRQFSLYWDTPESCIPPNVWDTSQQRCELPDGTPLQVEISNPSYDPGQSWYDNVGGFFSNVWDKVEEYTLPSSSKIEEMKTAVTGLQDVAPFGWLNTLIATTNCGEDTECDDEEGGYPGIGLPLRYDWQYHSPITNQNVISHINMLEWFDNNKWWIYGGFRQTLVYFLYAGLILRLIKMYAPRPIL